MVVISAVVENELAWSTFGGQKMLRDKCAWQDFHKTCTATVEKKVIPNGLLFGQSLSEVLPARSSGSERGGKIFFGIGRSYRPDLITLFYALTGTPTPKLGPVGPRGQGGGGLRFLVRVRAGCFPETHNFHQMPPGWRSNGQVSITCQLI